MIEYEDFSIKIEPRRGDIYPVIVLRSPAGEGRSVFTLPFEPELAGDLLATLGEVVRSDAVSPLRHVALPGKSTLPSQVSPAARALPQEMGEKLFRAVFSGPVLSLFDRSIGMLYGSDRGLRVKIHIDPEDPTLAPLVSLPWEFIYRRDTRDFLNLSRFTPIVRYLDVQRPHAPLPLTLPLRILVVISSPRDHVGLDVERERSLIQQTWARQDGVQVEFMEDASILALQRKLSRQAYHVLHYMGHGVFDEDTGQGVLVMENEQNEGQLVDGNALGILLRDMRTLRLVFLNACDTARVTGHHGLDPFAGVASAIVMAGIPAVVAMQFPISDQAAILFSGTFYPLLAQGNPVDVAVAEGRRAIRLGKRSTMEWGTPVLFMRAPNGDIFQVKATQTTLAGQEGDQTWEVVPGTLGRVERLYLEALAAAAREDWDRAVDGLQDVLLREPDFRDAEAWLEHASHQAACQRLYADAVAAESTGDWPGAISALETLSLQAPDYKDVMDRLDAARRRERLTRRSSPLSATGSLRVDRPPSSSDPARSHPGRPSTLPEQESPRENPPASPRGPARPDPGRPSTLPETESSREDRPPASGDPARPDPGRPSTLPNQESQPGDLPAATGGPPRPRSGRPSTIPDGME